MAKAQNLALFCLTGRQRHAGQGLRSKAQGKKNDKNSGELLPAGVLVVCVTSC
jgi:hypothetical protein